MRFWLTLLAVVGIGIWCLRSCAGKLLGGKSGEKPGVVAAAAPVSGVSSVPAPVVGGAPVGKPVESLCVYRFRNRQVPAGAVFAAAITTAGGGPDVSPAAISVDPASNAVIIKAAGLDAASIYNVCVALDVESSECYCDSWMVFVEGSNVENFEMEIGYNPASGVALSASSEGFGVAMPAGAFELKFSMLKSNGLLEVLDRPQIRLCSGEVAEVLTGQDVPVPTVTFQNGISTTGIEFKRVGLSFSVEPLFLPQNRVRLSCKAENGLLGAMVKVGAAEVPTISRQSVKGTATLGFDEAILLGGLETVRKEKRFGLLGEKEQVRTGRLYVGLVLRSGVPRAWPVPAGNVDPRAGSDRSLLPPKGWGLEAIDREIEALEQNLGTWSKGKRN